MEGGSSRELWVEYGIQYEIKTLPPEPPYVGICYVFFKTRGLIQSLVYRKGESNAAISD